MIGMPFFCWVVLAVFDFGNWNQPSAILAILGLALILKNWNKKRTAGIFAIDIVCFMLLAIPIVGRLVMVPLAMFNYCAFIVPSMVFVLCYLISLVYSYRQALAVN